MPTEGRRMLEIVLLTIGIVLAVVGIALVSVPAALIVAGVSLAGLALFADLEGFRR